MAVGSFVLRRKLSKVILLLGSDNVDERAGAVAAIKRLLAAEGLNFCDLADEIGASRDPSLPDSFVQDVQKAAPQRWTLDEIFAEEKFDFYNLADDIAASRRR
jgi:hypothetical protein